MIEQLEKQQLNENLQNENQENNYNIILYNDDYNTFDWVITCLMNYCSHIYIQAGQCADIVHNKGKCAVKQGSYNKLKPICKKLIDSNLTAKIE